jgi:tRNA-dihydrouridine synthase B
MKNSDFFSTELTQKIEVLKARTQRVKLGNIQFDSPLLLAPMSAICNSSFRVLMETLGAGGTVSELVSCHGINYKNERTLKMLELNPLEKNMGLQIFGEDSESMAKAASIVEEFKPKFIDINMGCPVRKVVNNGGGSALLKDPKKLSGFFKSIKNSIKVPLTIKIRTGWDTDSINALEVINIADGEGIEFVAIHGRTRTQQYKGSADWTLLEDIKKNSPLPIIGNGDLHTEQLVKSRMEITNCDALMLGRGPVRDPFIFLKPFINENENIFFTPLDYMEVIRFFNALMQEQEMRPRHQLIQLRKHIVWFAQGFSGVAKFRQLCFQSKTIDETMNIAEDYFGNLVPSNKVINPNETFMAGGHG